MHFKIVNGTNDKHTFAEFIQGLVGRIRGDAVVYMDNFSAHYSAKVKEAFNDRVMQRFLPAYSCTLNPIEKLWLLVKEKWRRAMLEHTHDLEDDECMDILRNLLNAEHEKCKSLASCHVKFLLKSLNDEFV